MRSRWIGTGDMGVFDGMSDITRRLSAPGYSQTVLFDHHRTGTEHVLLELARLGEGLAWRALDDAGVTFEAIFTAITRTVGRGASQSPLSIGYTEEMKRAFEYVKTAASRFGDAELDTGHVLLGLIGIGTCTAATVLGELDADTRLIGRAITTAQAVRRGGRSTDQGHDAGTRHEFGYHLRRVIAAAERSAIRGSRLVGPRDLLDELFAVVDDSPSLAGMYLAWCGVHTGQFTSSAAGERPPEDRGHVAPLPRDVGRAIEPARFGDEARMLVEGARRACGAGQRVVGLEHLLLALANTSSSPFFDVFAGRGFVAGAHAQTTLTKERSIDLLLRFQLGHDSPEPAKVDYSNEGSTIQPSREESK